MLIDDLRQSLRALRRAHLHAIAIVLTVALGVGATTAVYSVVHAVLLRPLPYADPQRLVWVAERNDKLDLPTFTTSALNFQSWLADPGPVRGLGAIGYTTYNWTGKGDPEQLTGGTLTATVFPTLGIRPVAGRSFTPAEEHLGAAPVAMISESLWERRFDRDRKVVGGVIDLDGVAHTVVGIAPKALTVIAPGDVWTPLVIDATREKRLSHQLNAIGRLPPGVTLAQAQSGMELVMRRVGVQYPEVKEWSIRLVTFPDWIVPSPIRTALFTLFAAVSCVLLIGAANIANLLLARALGREQEVAIRAALGASRRRVLAQLLGESLLLASAGGLLGCVAAFVTVRWAAAALPPNLLPITDIGMDRSVLAFAVLLSLGTGLLFGLVPAWQIAGTKIGRALRAGAREGVSRDRRRLQRALVASELALATALLVVAGVLVQSARRLGAVELGFHPDHLLTFQINLPAAKDAKDSRSFGFYRELASALASLPGVKGAAVSSGLPMGAGNFTSTPVRPTAPALLAPDDALTVDWRLASPDYFRVMGIPLLRGRSFTDADDRNAPPAMIVSHSLAMKFWGTEDVLGRTVQRVGDGKTFTVVGVVGDARLSSLNQIAPSLYYSSASRLWPLMDVVVRTTGEPEKAVTAVRGRIHELDAALPISNVRPMSYWVALSGAQPRLDAGLLSAFSGLALIIAALGIYGVLAHSVMQRNREIGLRMALGAVQGTVIRQFLSEGLLLGGVGIAIGLLMALLAGRALDDLVFGITAHDLPTMTLVTVLLAAVTVAASFVPAMRAARIDPMVTLREL